MAWCFRNREELVIRTEIIGDISFNHHIIVLKVSIWFSFFVFFLFLYNREVLVIRSNIIGDINLELALTTDEIHGF